MIEFSCQGCGQKFSVADHLAGRKGKCNACGGAIVIPHAVSAAPVGQRVPMRTRRLLADAEQMRATFVSDSHAIRIVKSSGDPPDTYELEYTIQSLGADPESGGDFVRGEHRVEIQLTSDYPRLAPHCRMLTPIFHPNIDASTICIGDHWAAGERLVDLVLRVGEMIAYQAYNIKSPLNAEAAMWADLNQSKLPLDARDLRMGGAQ